MFGSLAGVLLLTLTMAVLALTTLEQVVQQKDRVIEHDTQMVLAARNLMDLRDARAAANRGYLLSGRPEYLGEQYALDEKMKAQLTDLRQTVDTEHGRSLVSDIAQLQAVFVELDQSPVQLKQSGASTERIVNAWTSIDPQRLRTNAAMDALFSYLQKLVTEREQAATGQARIGILLIVVAFLAILAGATTAAVLMVRLIRRHVMTAVWSVQASSAGLLASARQQARGAGDQAATAAEISTTVKEMLTESRRIAEGARDVVEVAGQTSDAGRHGRDVVLAAQSSMQRIRDHSGSVNAHMNDLGQKARQISGVVEIVSELSELTNIVAINASIEAAGTGPEAARFAALADEIRTLADRVGDSTREIGELVAAVAEAVEETHRVSRDSTGLVEAGQTMVAQAVTSFEEIVRLVAVTMDSARQIQMSTSQQTVAVEQTDGAISAMAETTRAHQAAAGVTQRTADELAGMSYRLGSLVQTAQAPSPAATVSD